MLYQSLLLPIFATVVYAFPAAEPEALPQLPADLPSFPAWVQITNATAGGSGCPQGSFSQVISSTKDLLHITFDKYGVEAFPESKLADQFKFCNVNINVKFERGWTLAIETTDIRGFAWIDDKCSASVQGRFWWSGQQKDASCKVGIPGPFLGDYTKTVSLPTTAFVWSDCSADSSYLNIDTSISAKCDDKNNSAYIDVQAEDTKISTPIHWDLGLRWKRC